MSNLKNYYYQLLRRGTELLGLDLGYFASGGFWTTLGQGANTIIALLLTVAFANLLPKEIYGNYRYILSLAGIFNIFTLTGMNNAVVQATAAGNEGALRASVKYQLKWNFMMMLALWTLADYYFWQDNFIFAASFFVLGIFSPATQALNTYGAYLAGKKEFKLNNIFGTLATVIYAVGMFIALLLTKEIASLITIYALTTFIANLLFYYKTVKLFNLSVAPSKEMLKYGRHLTFISFMGPIVTQIDSVILAYFWGPAQLATYALARAIPDRAAPFIKDIINLGMPKLAKKTLDDINKVFYKRIFQAMILGAVLAIGYVITAPFIFKYIFPKYLESVFYSRLLAIGFIFAAPLGYMGTAFTAQKLTKSILAGSVSATVVKISLYVILGTWGGILGLVLAQLIYYVIVTFINIIIWKFNKSYDKMTT
ncbi:MAG: Polysaccharide biosynthesis protein [Candidatus Azambacteria bacterium GW2011_GWB1_42_17]|uniref:Polysaccharide biosynthesis protein n=2 Tax=Candidatus Azamiibacteriota TaxID=1752741 RepID=A0A0G0ZAK5_9BACT|nr:MAG: Polysaccharide biosynthesis protein [Candidatus Azambacteria bacterium GW2011_GWB1_42_17]KKS45767.1 MAG: Polysaccharide biosynthesis protein [Candidatus Azambacteria bacterium GW2011_GWA1_42_19]KKS88185.1 MAG: Polysaccharide biosynthesis protein [Parcubacteria group bacterium GW2011_GWC1_43_11]